MTGQQQVSSWSVCRKQEVWALQIRAQQMAFWFGGSVVFKCHSMHLQHSAEAAACVDWEMPGNLRVLREGDRILNQLQFQTCS